MTSLKKSFLVFTMLAIFALSLCACDCGDDDDDNDDADSPDDDMDDDADDDSDDDLNDDADDDTAPGDEVEFYQDGDFVGLMNNKVSLQYNTATGRFSIFDGDGQLIVEKAMSVAYSHVIVPAHRWRSPDMAPATWASEETTNPLGQGMTLLITLQGDDGEPDMELDFSLLDAESFVLMDMRMVNGTDERVNVGAMYPLLADQPFGALHFGLGTDLRVLTNGSLNYLEFIAPYFPGTVPVHSMWSALIFNQVTGRSIVAGTLTNEVAHSVVFTAPTHREDHGRKLHMVCQYDPTKFIDPGESLGAETMIFDFSGPTPFDALETFATRIKAWLGIQTWFERHPEIDVPVGWNSWSGSGSSGGYGTDINEEIIVENMDFADRELRRWGMNYFQIDDGYDPHDGDWFIDETKFPPHGDMNGIEWLLNRAKDKGFLTGLWISGFLAEKNSQIYNEQPELFADPLLGGLLDDDYFSLDLTDPVVQDHLAEVIQKYKDWGIQWLKLDFAYRGPLSTGWYEPNTTRGEFYREGVKIIRETLGDDIFLLNVAIKGWNYGLIDSLRLTLDTMPTFEGENPTSPIDNQGLKPMYRDAARWWWLHNRVWVNHPDLIFFRPHKDERIEPLTMNESLTFCSAVALQGGLVKIGDRIVDLEPDWVDGYRRIMPVYGITGRPLDVMQREYPEIWSLPVADFARPYHVIGLLNWGSNVDFTTLPYGQMPDEDRVIAIDFTETRLDPTATYHAWEYWTETYLGKVSGSLSAEVPARTPRVIALRDDAGRPQFLGTNRHVLAGVKIISDIQWDDAQSVLTGTQEASVGTVHAPFTHHLAFFVPDGFTFDDVQFGLVEELEINDADTQLTDVEGGQVLDLRFTVEDTNGHEEGDWFSDMTWSLSFTTN
jgi:hypothetical protein